MRIWRESDLATDEPDGHYGGVQAVDIVPVELTGNFSFSRMYCPPGSGGHLHQHEEQWQLFLVVSGDLTFDTGKERFTLGEMESVMFEAGEPHSTKNEGQAGSMVVVVTATS